MAAVALGTLDRSASFGVLHHHGRTIETPEPGSLWEIDFGHLKGSPMLENCITHNGFLLIFGSLSAPGQNRQRPASLPTGLREARRLRHMRQAQEVLFVCFSQRRSLGYSKQDVRAR